MLRRLLLAAVPAVVCLVVTTSAGAGDRAARDDSTAVPVRLHFDWATFDEGDGGKPEFLRELRARR